MKKIIVVSAINIYVGGPLTVLRECVYAIEKNYAKDYRVIVLVHDRNLIDSQGIEILEFKRSRSSWLFRMYYEYIYFWFFSLKLKPFLWLSLHDITPNVVAKRKAVYCHNASPFYKMTKREKVFDRTFNLFNKFYGSLYAINIKQNDLIIVQQDWIRKEFKKRYGIQNVMVALPVTELSGESVLTESLVKKIDDKKVFFYPALPRFFKNFEIIGQAVKVLQDKGLSNFEVLITIDGSENSYSASILEKFGDLHNLKFIGLQNRKSVETIYMKSDCLIFPSKLETWGLPITEYKRYNKPILAAGLPYAKETVGRYDKVSFFNPDDASKLAELMSLIITGNSLSFDKTHEFKYEQPFAKNWDEAFVVLFEELNSL